MSFAKEMSDFMGAYKAVTKTFDDSANTRANTAYTQARTRALTADQDFVDQHVGRTERRINTTNPTAAVGGTPTAGAPGAGGSGNVDAQMLDQYLGRMVTQESNGDPNARNPNSSATGLGQFIGSTWEELRQRHPELRLTPDGRTDPEQARRANRQLTLNNAGVLSENNLPVTPQNLYMTHFLGASGGPQFLRGLQQNPNAPATSLVTPEAANANRRVFFNSDGTPRTAQQVFNLQTRRFADIRMGSDQMPAQRTAAIPVESTPLAAPTRSQTAAVTPPSNGMPADYAEPVQFAEGGLVPGEQVPPRTGLSAPRTPFTAADGPLPASSTPMGSTMQAPQGMQPGEQVASAGQPGMPGDYQDVDQPAPGTPPMQAPVPQGRPSEDEIEKRQVAEALRSRPQPAPRPASAPQRQQETASPAPASQAGEPRRAALPVGQQPVDRETDRADYSTPQRQQAQSPQENRGIAGILDGAMRYIASRLPGARAIPTGAAAYALSQNEDTPTPSQYQTVSDAVDPSGEMSAGQRAIRVMQARHDLALQKGDLDGANRFAAGIIQYSQRLTARMASIGVVAGQQGNVGGMVAATTAAFNAIPVGAQITAGQPTRDGQIPITINEPNGRTRQLNLSPRQVMETALGLQNGGLYWETLQRAAAQHSTSQGGGMPDEEFQRHVSGSGEETPAAQPQTRQAQGQTPAPTSPAAPVAPASPITPPSNSAPAPAPTVPGAPPAPSAPAPQGETQLAETPAPQRATALPVEMQGAQRQVGQPSREPATPRPARPRIIPLDPRMNPEQRRTVEAQNRAAEANYREALKAYQDELNAIRREDQQQRSADNAADRSDAREAAKDTRAAQRDVSRQEAEGRLEAARARHARLNGELTERRTRQTGEINAARLTKPDASTMRTIQPDVEQVFSSQMNTGGQETGVDGFQRMYAPDAAQRPVAKRVYNNMVEVASKLAIWGSTPQVATEAAQIMIGTSLPGGVAPYRVLPEKDPAGNTQIVLLQPGRGANAEPQEVGGVIRVDTNTLRQIENARREFAPLATARRDREAQPSMLTEGLKNMGLGYLGFARDADAAVTREIAGRPGLVTDTMRQNRRNAIREEAQRVEGVGRRQALPTQ